MSQIGTANAPNRVEMSHSLRGSLQRAMTHVYQQSHPNVTLEHLLLALADDAESAVILEASAIDIPALRADVSEYLGRIRDRVEPGAAPEPAIGGDVQHIIQSAAAAAQKSRRHSISSALVLAAIVGDGRSPAAEMLRRRGLTFENAIEALKRSNATAVDRPTHQQAASGAPAAQPPRNPDLPSSAPTPKQVPPAAPDQVMRPSPAAAPDSAVPGGARLQNVQAAHEIIANARERIAAARSAIAAASPDARPPEGAAAQAHSAAHEPGDADMPPAGGDREPQQRAARANTRPQEAAPSSADRLSAPSTQPPPMHDEHVPPAVSEMQETAALPVSPPPSADQRPPAMPAAPQQRPLVMPQQHQHNQRHPQAPEHARPPPPAPPATLVAPPHAAHAQPASLPHTLPPTAQPPARPPMQPPRPEPQRPSPPPQQQAAPRPAHSHRPSDASPIEPEKLVEGIPGRMCVGVPTTIEIRAPRARLEAWSGGNQDPRTPDDHIITKAMAMRLKAPEGGFTIEIASPETQWSEGYTGPLSDDVVSWRWIVTPVRSGRHSLQLHASTRVVGRDGLAAARSLPEQLVSVRVAPNYGEFAMRLSVWLLVAGLGIALGYFGEQLFSMGRTILAGAMR